MFCFSNTGSKESQITQEKETIKSVLCFFRIFFQSQSYNFKDVSRAGFLRLTFSHFVGRICFRELCSEHCLFKTILYPLASPNARTHLLSTPKNVCRQNALGVRGPCCDRVGTSVGWATGKVILPWPLTKSRMSWSTSGSGSSASRSGGERERLLASLLSARPGLGAGGRPAPSSRPCASARYPEACSPRAPASSLRGRRSPASSRRRRRLSACDWANSSCQHRRNSSRPWSSMLDAPGPTRHPQAASCWRTVHPQEVSAAGRKLPGMRLLGSGRPRPSALASLGFCHLYTKEALFLRPANLL